MKKIYVEINCKLRVLYRITSVDTNKSWNSFKCKDNNLVKVNLNHVISIEECDGEYKFNEDSQIWELIK